MIIRALEDLLVDGLGGGPVLWPGPGAGPAAGTADGLVLHLHHLLEGAAVGLVDGHVTGAHPGNRRKRHCWVALNMKQHNATMKLITCQVIQRLIVIGHCQ